MDGGATDPPPDPQCVLRELIRQAQASTSATPTPVPLHATSSLGEDDHHHDDCDSVSSSQQAAEASSVGQSDEHASWCPGRNNDGEQLLPYMQIAATLACIAADRRELVMLLRQKKSLAVAHRRNVSHQLLLETTNALLLKTRDELKSALGSLDVADVVDAEDQSLEVIRVHRVCEDAATVCPFSASMVQHIPLLRLQSIERAEYDNALRCRLWMEAEDEQLRAAVKAAALKVHAIALGRDSTFRGDALAQAAGMDDDEALRLAETIECDELASSADVATRATKRLDWATIAARMPSRSVDEIRTRWHGVLRPSVNTRRWSNKEVDDVIRLATPHLAAYLTHTQPHISTDSTPCVSRWPIQAPVPWLNIAHQLGTRRTAYACFVAFCSALVQRDQPHMRSSEDEHINELFSLFRGAWRFMALHNTASPNMSVSHVLTPSTCTATSALGEHRPATLLGKVGRDAQTMYRRFRNTTDPALATGLWSLQEDVLLLDAVRSVGGENWAAVAVRVGGRTSSQCRERYNRRLKRVADEMGGGQAHMDAEQIAKLLQNKKKLTWTNAMDHMLLAYLDEQMKGKGGTSFASIARHMAEKTGLSLSDKNVRDRTVVLRRNKLAAQAKHGKAAEGRQQADGGDAGTGGARSPSGQQAGDAVEQATPIAEQRVQDAWRGVARARTVVLPGAKRRKT